MRLFLFTLCVSSALLFTPALAPAEDAPPPPVGQTALTQPAPAAPQTPAPAATVPVVARKEETEVKIRSGFFAGLFPSKGAISIEQAADELSKLRAENDDLRKQLADAQTELKAISDDWPAIREALLAGKADAPVLQKPLGQQAMQATAAAVAANAASTGHDPKRLPGPGAAKPDTGKTLSAAGGQPLDRRQQAAATADYWAARNAPWAIAPANSN